VYQLILIIDYYIKIRVSCKYKIKVIKRGNLLYDMVPSILPPLVIENPIITLVKNRQFLKNKIETFLTTLDQNLQQETENRTLFKKQLNKFQEGFTYLTELTETSNSTDADDLNEEQKNWNRDMSMKNFDDKSKLLSLEMRVSNIRDSISKLQDMKDDQSQLLGYSNEMKNVVSLYETMIDEQTLKDKENLLAFKERLANMDMIIPLEKPFFMSTPTLKLSKKNFLKDTNGDKSKSVT
jgi:hypothetical protein